VLIVNCGFVVNFDDEFRALNSCELMGMINFMKLMCLKFIV